MVELFSTDSARVTMDYQSGHKVEQEEIDLTVMADVKTYKALGSKFTAKKVKRFTRIDEETGGELPEDSKNPDMPDLFG